MYWLTQGLRVVSFRWNQVSWQHGILRETFLNLFREEKTYLWFVSSWRLREIKMSCTCSLFPPFGDHCPSCLLPSQGSFLISQLFAWGGQTTGVSASASILPMNTQDWSPLGWTGWISLQCKGFSRAFSNTTIQKHQFFGTQLSSQSNSLIHTWPMEKP